MQCHKRKARRCFHKDSVTLKTARRVVNQKIFTSDYGSYFLLDICARNLTKRVLYCEHSSDTNLSFTSHFQWNEQVCISLGQHLKLDHCAAVHIFFQIIKHAAVLNDAFSCSGYVSEHAMSLCKRSVQNATLFR